VTKGNQVNIPEPYLCISKQ